MCLRVYFKYTGCNDTEANQIRYCKFKSDCEEDERTAAENKTRDGIMGNKFIASKEKLWEPIELRWKGKYLDCELSNRVPTLHQKDAAKGLIIFQRIRKHCKGTRSEGHHHLDTVFQNHLDKEDPPGGPLFLDLPYDYVDSAHEIQKQLTASLQNYKCFRSRESTKEAIQLVYEIRRAIQWTIVDYLIESPEANVPSNIIRRTRSDLDWRRPYPLAIRLHAFRKSMILVEKGTMLYVQDGKRFEGVAVCPICLCLECSVQIWCPEPCKNLFGRRCLEKNLILGGTAKCPKCGQRPVELSGHSSGPKPWWLTILDGGSLEGRVRDIEKV